MRPNPSAEPNPSESSSPEPSAAASARPGVPVSDAELVRQLRDSLMGPVPQPTQDMAPFLSSGAGVVVAPPVSVSEPGEERGAVLRGPFAWFVGLGLAAQVGVGSVAAAVAVAGAGAAGVLPGPVQGLYDAVVDAVLPEGDAPQDLDPVDGGEGPGPFGPAPVVDLTQDDAADSGDPDVPGRGDEGDPGPGGAGEVDGAGPDADEATGAPSSAPSGSSTAPGDGPASPSQSPDTTDDDYEEPDGYEEPDDYEEPDEPEEPDDYEEPDEPEEPDDYEESDEPGEPEDSEEVG